MILSSRFAGVAVTVFAASVIGRSITNAVDSTPASRAPRIESSRALEVARIRAHFDSVLTELSAKSRSSVPTVDAMPRQRRASLLSALRAYRDRGDFPHNYDFPGQAVPYFIDRKTGTLCAVAYLLESTGRRDIVERVAARDNNVWVAALAGDTAFTTWLDTYGLSLAEAARIQVPYVMSEAKQNTYVAMSAVTVVSALTTVGTGVYNATGNRDGHAKWSNRIGLVTGLITTTAGSAFAMQDDVHGRARTTGWATAAVGGASIALSTRGMFRQRTFAAKQRTERDVERRRAAASASIAPILPLGSGQGAGVSVALRF